MRRLGSCTMEYQKKHDGVLILLPEGSEQSVDTTLAKGRQTDCVHKAGRGLETRLPQSEAVFLFMREGNLGPSNSGTCCLELAGKRSVC